MGTSVHRYVEPQYWLGSGGWVMDADSFVTQREWEGSAAGGVEAELGAAGFVDAELIGWGGFGVVYRCAQVGLDRVVAVKVLTAVSAGDRARFVRERQAMAWLTGHPNVVPVLQVGQTAAGWSYLVMPYCERGSLQERIGRAGALAVGAGVAGRGEDCCGVACCASGGDCAL